MSKREKQLLKKLAIAPVGVALLFAGGCSDGGSLTPAAPEAVAGKVVQGPVSGATVYADKGFPNNNLKLDEGESKTLTDANGLFAFDPVPDYTDYILVSEGGLDTVTNKPAKKNLAPKGAKRVTPLTTLVALSDDPEATRAAIESLGGDYDTDLSDPNGVSPELMKLSKAIEATQDLFASDSLGLPKDDTGTNVSPSVQLGIMKEAARQLVDAASKNSSPNDVIKATMTQTADAVVSDPKKLSAVGSDAEEVSIAVDNKDAFVATAGKVVDSVNEDVEASSQNGKVVETTVQDNLEDPANAVDTEQELDAAILVSMDVTKCWLDNDEEDPFVPGESQTPIQVSSDFQKIWTELSHTNGLDNARTYDKVAITLQVQDDNSDREAVVFLKKLALTVPADENASLQVNLDNAELYVQGTTAAGFAVGTQEAITGTFEGFGFEGNRCWFDVAALQQQLVGTGNAAFAEFADITAEGDYTIKIKIDGVPVANRFLTMNVSVSDFL